MEDLFIKFFDLLITIPTVLIALTFHECAHGFVAYKLGDPTAKYMGRLSLNPLKHLDPIGALCMVLCGFGWAKPVPVDMRQFKNPKSGMALCALAGPLTNLILGFIGAFLYWLIVLIFPSIVYNWNILSLLSIFGVLNIYLAIFNLIPLPPFDGSRILSAFLPDKYYIKLMQYERYIALGFFLVLLADDRFLGGHITGALATVVYWIFNGFLSFFNLFV
ncbi:MAG: site-2 protease family protein [Clostridia bacterium]|nr:site-2 protease family protein [Clostridia bacterium]